MGGSQVSSVKERIAASKGARRSWLEIEYGWKYRMSEFDRDERRWYQRHRHSFSREGEGDERKKKGQGGKTWDDGQCIHITCHPLHPFLQIILDSNLFARLFRLRYIPAIKVSSESRKSLPRSSLFHSIFYPSSSNFSLFFLLRRVYFFAILHPMFATPFNCIFVSNLYTDVQKLRDNRYFFQLSCFPPIVKYSLLFKRK